MNTFARGITTSSARDGAIVFSDVNLGIDLLALFHVGIDPNGIYTAPRGSLVSGVVGPYVNTDGATAWSRLMFESGPAGGDLAGFYPDPLVMGICGHPIDGTNPANGDALLYNSFTGMWTHTPITFSGGPPTGPAGGDLGGLYPNPVVIGLQMAPLPVAPVADGFLKRDTANTGWEEVTYGSAANTVCEGDDVRLSNARTPTVHASTHAGGSDPLTVNSTTAMNNSSTTGLTVNTATAAISTVDPGHSHGVTDLGHTHTVGSTTASNTAYTIGFHETFGRINADFRTMGTIDQTVASVAPASQTAHLRTMDVVFPAGWVGGTVTVNGIGSLGQVVAEVHTKPLGGGRTSGVKTFASVTSYTNSAPAGAPGTVATVTIAALLGVSNYPVKAFIKTSNDGTDDTFSATDLVNGTFDTTTAHTGNHTVEIWYTVDVQQPQVAHTHTLTSNTTGVSVNSNTTGVSASDTGHTHGVADAGHNHTQSAHGHALSG